MTAPGEKQEGKLDEDMQRFVVTSLAMFDPLSVVKANLEREYGVQISAQSIEYYDPTKRAGRKLLKHWKELFETTRKAFLEEAASIPIANRSVRLRALDRMAMKAETEGELEIAAALHEQAAKEVGDVYTNTRKLAGNDGGAIKVDGLSQLMSMIDGGSRSLAPKG